jgi:hypothetical protein
MASPQKRRIVIGDVHGELAGFREILLHAGLINERFSWTGGASLLIQVGDVIDRGPCSRECVALLRSLQNQAPKAGGQVVRLCGNHELMLLQGDFWSTDCTAPTDSRSGDQGGGGGRSDYGILQRRFEALHARRPAVRPRAIDRSRRSKTAVSVVSTECRPRTHNRPPTTTSRTAAVATQVRTRRRWIADCLRNSLNS